MIDSHCHLTDPRLLSQLEEVLMKCAVHGVTEQVTIGTSPEDGEAARALARKHPSVWFVAGIHPNEAGNHGVAEVERVRELAADPKCVAIGEMGLDFYWKDVPRERQEPVFRAQLALARELGRSVVIHSRESVREALAVMAEFPEVRGVFHCFTGTVEEARAIAEAGHYVGFTGALTFKRNEGLRQAAAELPIDRILIETDAPYMTPEPHRGVKINDPSYVRFVLEVLARARGVSAGEMDRVTVENTRRLYRFG